MSVLRAEIQNKQIQVLDLESQLQKEKEKLQESLDHQASLKKQISKMRRIIEEKEAEAKENMARELERKTLEIASMKETMRTKQELEQLKSQVSWNQRTMNPEVTFQNPPTRMIETVQHERPNPMMSSMPQMNASLVYQSQPNPYETYATNNEDDD